MSVTVTALAWYVGDMTPAQKAVLLALADHADEDGNRVYPAVERLCIKTSYAERTVRRALADLREMGLIHIVHEATRYKPTGYRIDLPQMQARQNRPPAGVPEMHPSTPPGVPENTAGVPESPRRGARNAPDPPIEPSVEPPIEKERESPQGLESEFDFDENPTLSQKPLLDRAKLFKGKIPAGQGETAAEIFFEFHPYTASLLNALSNPTVHETVENLAVWRDSVQAWMLEGNKPGNINGQLEWYQTGKRSNRESYQNGAMNGTHRRNNGFAGTRQEPAPEPEFVADVQFLAQMERENARRNGRAVAEWAADELRNL